MGSDATRLNVSINLNSNAVAFTQQTDVLIAAPGAGFRLRVFSVSLRKVPINAAQIAASLSVTFLHPSNFCALGLGPQLQGDTIVFDEVGVPGADNTALNIRELCDIATVPLNAMAVYAIESTTV